MLVDDNDGKKGTDSMRLRDPIDRKRSEEEEECKLLERMERAIMQWDIPSSLHQTWPRRRSEKGVNWLISLE